MNSKKTKNIAITGALIAIEILLQLIGNYISFTGININLSLLPIAIGAIICGPISGLIIGLVNGVMAIFAPGTISFFMPYGILQTVIICLFKTSIAGFSAGLIYKALKDKNKFVAFIVTSISIPLINTGLFIALLFILIPKLVQDNASSGSYFSYVIFTLVGWNFIFELASTLALSGPLSKAVEHLTKPLNE